MGIAESAEPVRPDPDLPEQRLLRDPNRLDDIVGAFLRGEITAVEYSEMTLAEINERAASEQVIAPDPPAAAPHPPQVVVAAGGDSATELANAFVAGRLSVPDYLRLVRRRPTR